MTSYGTITLFDSDVIDRRVADFGESATFETLRANLDSHNQLVRQMVAELADPSADRQRAYGFAELGEMVQADEYTAADAQRAVSNGTVGFPMYLFQYSIQWTRSWMQTHSLGDLEVQYTAARQADINNIAKQLKRAIFTATNNTTYLDRRVDSVNYTLRALLNADSQGIPLGPNGESFDETTHTHYLANATLTEAKALELLETVIEHGHGGNVRIYINRAQEAAWRLFTAFRPYVDSREILDNTGNYARGNLDRSNLYNRAIGLFNGAEVWVKSWVPSHYAFAFDASDNRKPLVYRTRANTTLGDLQIAADHEQYPLRAQYMEREFGFGIWTRTNGAVLYSNGGAYVIPTF